MMINLPTLPILLSQIALFFVVNLLIWIVITKKIKAHYVYLALLYTGSVWISRIVSGIVMDQLDLLYTWIKTVSIGTSWATILPIILYPVLMLCGLGLLYFQFLYAPYYILTKFAGHLTKPKEIKNSVSMTFVALLVALIALVIIVIILSVMGVIPPKLIPTTI